MTVREGGPGALAAIGRLRWRRIELIEAIGLFVAPALLFWVLSIRGMAPPGLPDPSMHTAYILDPGAVFKRYGALFEPTARLREAARVGFLVPARISYLLFGAVPGFFVLRYVLALVAIVPAYLLLRRLYGRWAGVLAVVLVMSSPVVLTAWGTDYPDCAAVSYLTGATCALALALQGGRSGKRWWLLGGGLLTLAVWTHGVAAPIVIVLGVCYLVMRWRLTPETLVSELLGLVVVAAAVTLVLAVGSKLLIGQFDFIAPTIRSALLLSKPAWVQLYHSSSWGWAPYDNYLLVPVAVVGLFAVVYARRPRPLPSATLFVGLSGTLTLAVLAYLQFFGSLQTLEMHYFSSTLWSSANVLLALALAEMVERPLTRTGQYRRNTAALLRALPTIIVLLIAEGYARVHVRVSMTWSSGGLALGAAIIAIGVIWRLDQHASPTSSSPKAWRADRGRLGRAYILAGAVFAVSLLLTVAVPPPHRHPAGTILYDPYPAYAEALGGSYSRFVDVYRVDAMLPHFVGDPSYRGEILLTWPVVRQIGNTGLQGPVGLYHNSFTWVSGTFPVPGEAGLAKIRDWRAAQVLLMSLTGAHFRQAVASLEQFAPVVAKRGILRAGPLHVHLWLVDLTRYMRHARD